MNKYGFLLYLLVLPYVPIKYWFELAQSLTGILEWLEWTKFTQSDRRVGLHAEMWAIHTHTISLNFTGLVAFLKG